MSNYPGCRSCREAWLVAAIIPIVVPHSVQRNHQLARMTFFMMSLFMSYGQRGFGSSLRSDDFMNGSGEYRDAGTVAAIQPLVRCVTEHPVHPVNLEAHRCEEGVEVGFLSGNFMALK